MHRTEAILKAVDQTRPQWDSLLTAEDRRILDRWLEIAASGEAEDARRAINLVLNLLTRYPQAQAAVAGALADEESVQLEAYHPRGYEPMAGQGEYIPAGTMMVCPVDPAHYRRRLRQKGQQLVCPEHGIALVQESSIERR